MIAHMIFHIFGTNFDAFNLPPFCTGLTELDRVGKPPNGQYPVKRIIDVSINALGRFAVLVELLPDDEHLKTGTIGVDDHRMLGVAPKTPTGAEPSIFGVPATAPGTGMDDVSIPLKPASDQAITITEPEVALY